METYKRKSDSNLYKDNKLFCWRPLGFHFKAVLTWTLIRHNSLWDMRNTQPQESIGNRKTLLIDNNDLNQVVASSGFSENKVLILAGSWNQVSVIFLEIGSW